VLGPLTYSEEQGEVFLGHSVAQSKSVSDETAHTIDQEVRVIIDRNYQRSRKILTDNMDKMHMMADALIKYETIDAAQIDDIMEGRTPRPPQDWSDHEPHGGVKAEEPKSDKPSEKEVGGPAESH
jgi:cell division protease FtsH